jgi:DNA-binding HxlR family transcriptional regulator
MKNNDEEICRRSQCAISAALETVGDKWSLLILRDLMFSGKRTYGELQASDEKIATNILAARLLSLEASGIIRKMPDPDHGRRNLYLLTEKGIDLVAVVVELRQWAEKYAADVSSCPGQLKWNSKNRHEVLTAYKKKLRKEHGVI